MNWATKFEPSQYAALKPIAKSEWLCKSECYLSLDTPQSPYGLFINLVTFGSYGYDFVKWDAKRTNCAFYLQIRSTPQLSAIQHAKPIKMAIGTSDGFQAESNTFENIYQLYLVAENLFIPLESGCIPPKIQEVCQSVIQHEGSQAIECLESWEADIKTSKYCQNLPIVRNPPKIPSCNWKCELCGATQNLWLNLSDGFIGCGRKLYGGHGGCQDGKEGAALIHFLETQKLYPLVVKLGTITASSADVFSYAEDEDDSVKDTFLPEHLQRFGIEIQALSKTDKSTSELEIDANLRHDWTNIIDGQDNCSLIKIGCLGLINLGNTCYMNAVLQSLCHTEGIETYFSKVFENIFAALTTSDNPKDILILQFAKIVISLMTSRYITQYNEILKSIQDENLRELCVHWLKPSLFRRIANRGHPEFSTSKQQDAEEYLAYLLPNLISSELQAVRNLQNKSFFSNFFIKFEQRLECMQSNRVNYSEFDSHILSLQIPEDGKTYQPNSQEQPAYDLQTLLNFWAEQEIRSDFFSPVTGNVGKAAVKMGIKKFPKYLILHIKRFYAGEDWTPKKIHAHIHVPVMLNLQFLRSNGCKPDELLMTPSVLLTKVEEENMEALKAMGFNEELSREAIIKNRNETFEKIVEWLFLNQDKITQDSGMQSVSEDSLQILLSMGFNSSLAKKALAATKSDVPAAISWMENHMDADLGVDDANLCQNEEMSDCDGIYTLKSFITHLGKSTTCGHYVCHAKVNDKWILFNDAKTSEINSPPLSLGYLYFFESAKDGTL